MHYLGIDWGKANIGLAIADSESGMAFRYGTVKNEKKVIEKIGEIIKKEKISTVIMGIPSYINKEEIEYEAEEAGRVIAERCGVEVEFENEMFTTKMAHQNLIESGAKNIKTLDDAEAARLILQSWIDKKSEKN